MYIWVDDTREAPANSYHARTYAQAVSLIKRAQLLNLAIYIDLDHDLGEAKSGYDIAKYIVANRVKNVRWRVHSMNPVGRANIEQLLEHYGYRRF